VLVLLGLYALAGLGYAAWVHSDDSVAIWTGIAVGAFIAAFAYHRFVTIPKNRRGMDPGT